MLRIKLNCGINRYMKKKDTHQSKMIEETEGEKLVIRCLNCNKRLFDGLPGWDIIKNKPKEQDIICSRCGEKNVISSEISEKIVQRIVKVENN